MRKTFKFAVKHLNPGIIHRVLKSTDVKYGKREITVVITDKVCLQEFGGDGRKAFAVLINLETGVTKTTWGSWGGANMFVSNQVDNDPTEYVIPANGIVIKGSIGYGPTWATIYASPESFQKREGLHPSLAEIQGWVESKAARLLNAG